jgi:hypothetical protein
MTPRLLDLRDHDMHRLRNLALVRVLASALRAQEARTMAARTRALAKRGRRSTSAGRTVRTGVSSTARRPLRLVKG